MTQAVDSSSSFFGRRFGRWLDRRIPPSPEISLSQRNVFIFPTRTGFVFGGLLLLLVLAAINYQASLVYGVAFLLGSVFLVTILYTFRNLSGLRLEFAGTRPGFVGEDIEFSIRVVRPQDGGRGRRGREGIQIGFPDGIVQWVDLHHQEADLVRLYVQGSRRGYLHPGRLLVETYYPLGLLRAWTWVDLDARALVYPRPLFSELPELMAGRRDEGQLIDPQGSEDFTDIKAYQPGDPVKHIIWRSYARGDELMVKRYASFMEPRLWLDLDDVGGGLEERLSRLTGMALQAARLGREFGLRLGKVEVKPAVGEAHLERVLRELALYGS
ncbi:MAG: DUF58 domain-containing protein [Pseudomonadales bacterium]